MRQLRVRRRDQQSNKRVSWPEVDVRKGCTYDRAFWISTDVRQDAQVVVELDHTRRIAEQQWSKKGWIKVMQ